MAGPSRSGNYWIYFFRLGNEGLNVDKKTLFLSPKSDWDSLFVIVGVVDGTAVFVPYQALERGILTMVAPLIVCYPLITLIPNRFFGKGPAIFDCLFRSGINNFGYFTFA